ncbi:hypothetical protein FVE85_7579 [Porphyridium purpureum]|uniref:Glycosyltransferase family 92 protein n=1 Tax=Porphyridium purpureum TaxID=35688 RepID=A0A5J4ZAK5_PORPP|nr:hypothetical protein FVE85_7579 [Porphyridium purpureum]|eukprot:POR0265..scf295_1
MMARVQVTFSSSPQSLCPPSCSYWCPRLHRRAMQIGKSRAASHAIASVCGAAVGALTVAIYIHLFFGRELFGSERALRVAPCRLDSDTSAHGFAQAPPAELSSASSIPSSLSAGSSLVPASGSPKCTSSWDLILEEPIVFFSQSRASMYVVSVHMHDNTVHVELFYAWIPIQDASEWPLLQKISAGLLQLQFVPDTPEALPIDCKIVDPDHVYYYVQVYVCYLPTTEQAEASAPEHITGTLQVAPELQARIKSAGLNVHNVIPEAIKITACVWDPATGHVRVQRAPGGSALFTLLKPSYTIAGDSFEPSAGERMREWAIYHLSLGFSHIFIYVDGKRDLAERIMRPLVEAGLVSVIGVRRIEVPGAVWLKESGTKRVSSLATQQIVVFSHHLDRYKPYYSYMSALDVDEFMFINDSVRSADGASKQGTLLEAFVANVAGDAFCPTGVFRLRWQYLFPPPVEKGSAKLSSRCVDVFQLQQTELSGRVRFLSKTFFNMRAVTSFMDIHGPQRKSKDCAAERYLDGDVAHIAHFRVRLRDQDQAKLPEPRNVTYMKQTWDAITPPFWNLVHRTHPALTDAWISTHDY